MVDETKEFELYQKAVQTQSPQGSFNQGHDKICFVFLQDNSGCSVKDGWEEDTVELRRSLRSVVVVEVG